MKNDNVSCSDYYRVVQMSECENQVSVVLMVDLIGSKKFGVSAVYPSDNGKLITHVLEGLYDSQQKAVVEIESNWEGLLSQLNG